MTNTWQQLTLDVTYALSAKIGIGFSYMYEKFDVEDFATINTAGPQTLPRPDLGAQTDTARIDWFGGLHDRLRQPALQGPDRDRAGVLQLLILGRFLERFDRSRADPRGWRARARHPLLLLPAGLGRPHLPVRLAWAGLSCAKQLN